MCNEIFQNSKISARAKGIFGYIMTLPDNWELHLNHLYNQFSEGRDAINTALTELETFGYLFKKRVTGTDQSTGGWDITFYESVEKQVSPTGNQQLLNIYNNTNRLNINTKDINSNNSIVKKHKSDIRDLFKTRYEAKTKEISGSAAKLPWSGKEGKLLILDLETHGFDTLIKYIEIFFSDKDNTIADFTRHRNKAGYSFSVFHGMLSKLALSKIKPAIVCTHCGRAIGHDDNCIIKINNRKMIEIEKEEINRFKEENKNVSFSGAILDIINKESTNG